MKKSILITFTMLLFIATSLFAASTTPTITFNVPLQLAKLHQNVTEVSVQCVGNNQTNDLVTSIVRSSSARPDANGNINQIVTVTVPAQAGKDISAATKYSCTLWIKYVGLDGWGQPGTSSTHVELQAKAGVPFVSEVTGNINW